MDPKQWLLALAVPVILFSGIMDAFPQNWTLTSAPITNWTCVASSADGQRLVATAGGGIYTSTNAGISWSLTSAPGMYWVSVTSSADGSKLAASGVTTGHNAVYASINSGASWFQTVGAMTWGPIASSSDGSELVMDVGGIYISTNSGSDWKLVVDFYPMVSYSVACSADANVLAASVFGGGPYGGIGAIQVSTNSGVSWTMSYAPFMGLGAPSAVAMSADGTKMIAAAGGGLNIYTSTNSGRTFDETSAPRGYWSSVASSADGSKLVVVAGDDFYDQTGPIYTSADSGNTWQSNAAPIAIWSSVASSADGCKLVATINGGGIYTWQTAPTPVLRITPSDTNYSISWIVSSLPFVLQENRDLTTTHWTDVTTTPILNLANLRYEVSLPLSSTGQFYRLKGL